MQAMGSYLSTPMKGKTTWKCGFYLVGDDHFCGLSDLFYFLSLALVLFLSDQRGAWLEKRSLLTFASQQLSQVPAPQGFSAPTRRRGARPS